MMMTGARRHSTSTSRVCRLAPDGWRCRAPHFSIARTGYRTVLMLSASRCFWRCTARVSRWTRRAAAWKRETGPARYCPQQGAVGNAASVDLSADQKEHSDCERGAQRKFFAGEGPSKRAVRAARPVFIESREAFQRLDTFMQREYGHASLRAAGGAL